MAVRWLHAVPLGRFLSVSLSLEGCGGLQFTCPNWSSTELLHRRSSRLSAQGVLISTAFNAWRARLGLRFINSPGVDACRPKQQYPCGPFTMGLILQIYQKKQLETNHQVKEKARKKDNHCLQQRSV